MLLKCFVLLCSVVSCLSKREIGQACLLQEENIYFPAVCKPLSECPYAMARLYDDEKNPQMCWWEGETRIVCCQNEDLRHRLGLYGRLYDPLSNGAKRSRSTICRYDGEMHHCCPNVPDRPLPDETGCPPLDKPAPPPTLSPVQLIAWNKCVENLRFVNQCIAEKDDRKRLFRHYECIEADPFRISSGTDANPKEFPHMVVLGVAEKRVEGSNFDGEWVGGGALVSDRFVLTAGHVLIDPAGRPLRYALMGCLNKKDVLSGLLHIVVRKIPHPLYQWGGKLHDIALVELDRPVPLSSFVRPICLPVPGQDTDPKRELLIAGWGRTAESANATDLLQKATVSIQKDYSECQKLESSEFRYNSSTMLCVKGKLKGVVYGKTVWTDTCPGDSGGPLMSVLSNVNCSYRAEGVVSFGPPCGQGSASVYTRVEHYLDWIVQNVWKDEWERATGNFRQLGFLL